MLEICILRGMYPIERNMIELFKVGTVRKQLGCQVKDYTYALYAARK